MQRIENEMYRELKLANIYNFERISTKYVRYLKMCGLFERVPRTDIQYTINNARFDLKKKVVIDYINDFCPSDILMMVLEKESNKGENNKIKDILQRFIQDREKYLEQQKKTEAYNFKVLLARQRKFAMVMGNVRQIVNGIIHGDIDIDKVQEKDEKDKVLDLGAYPVE